MAHGRKRLIPFVLFAALALAPAASAAGANRPPGFGPGEPWAWLGRVLEVLGLAVGGSGDPNGDGPTVGVGGDPDGLAPPGWDVVGLAVGGSGDPNGGEVPPPPAAPSHTQGNPGSGLDDR
jgi:hypothetical protein